MYPLQLLFVFVFLFGTAWCTIPGIPESPTHCEITVKGPKPSGLFGKEANSRLVEYASFKCTGENLPVKLQVHPEVLESVQVSEGVILERLETLEAYVRVTGVVNLLIDNSNFENLVGGKYAPVTVVGSTVRFVNCYFSRNSLGRAGAMHITNSVVVMHDSAFVENMGLSYGAVAVLENSKFALHGCNLLSNEGGTPTDAIGGFVSGGIFSHKGSAVKVIGSNFLNNRALGSGGGAVTSVNKCAVTVADSILERNTGEAGAILAVQFTQVAVEGSTVKYNRGRDTSGTITLRISSNVELKNTVFTENVGGTGGILALGGSNLNLVDTGFVENVGTVWGGAISVMEGGDVSVIRGSFTGNRGSNGGAVFGDSAGDVLVEGAEFKKNVGGKIGGAVYQKNCAKTVINLCVFTDNSATVGGGAVAQVGCSDSSSTGHDLAGCDGSETHKCLDVSISGASFNGNSAGKYGRDIFQSGCNTLSLFSSVFARPSAVATPKAVFQEVCKARKVEANTVTSALFARNRNLRRELVSRSCPTGNE